MPFIVNSSSSVSRATIGSAIDKRRGNKGITTEGTNYGEYALIHAIIVAAIHEAASYRNPRIYEDIPLGPNQRGTARPGSREIRSYKARRWINTKNRYFTHYCNRLGWSAPWVRKKINEYLARVDGQKRTPDRRRTTEGC